MVFTFSGLRLKALRANDVEATRAADNGNGIGALLLYGAGFFRLFGGLEKPLGFYTQNPVFWVKMGLLALASVLELYPQYVVLPWHFRHARKQPIEPKPGQFERLYTCALLELPCMVGIVICASLMARGIGLPSAARASTTAQSPGQAIYATHCQSCHQADGRGVGGKVAASFVDDPRILAKPDADLLDTIAKGKVGPVGAMPAWGATLTEEHQRQVLAYIRVAFGPQR